MTCTDLWSLVNATSRFWDGIVERLVRMGEIVPDSAAMGYHFVLRKFWRQTLRRAT